MFLVLAEITAIIFVIVKAEANTIHHTKVMTTQKSQMIAWKKYSHHRVMIVFLITGAVVGGQGAAIDLDRCKSMHHR